MIELHWSWVIGLVVWATLAKAFGALMFGLWWGERGRRKAAENWKVAGDPDGRGEAVVRAPAKEAEDRFAESARLYTEEAVEAGIEDMMAEAEAKGIVVDEAEIRRDVIRMLSGENVEA